jgi:hypothetical protein
MGCQKKHRPVNPHFAERLRNVRASHAMESAENEGWPATSMGMSVSVHATGEAHGASRKFHFAAARV